MSVAAIVIVLIFAIVGWVLYAVYPTTSTTTTTVTGAASTVTVSGVGSTVTVSGVTSTVTAAAATWGAPTSTTDSFTIGYFPAPVAAISGEIYYGNSSGIFKQYIPNVSWSSLGTNIASLLASDEVQMAITSPSTFVPAFQAGAPIQLVATLNPFAEVMSLEVAGNSSITSPMQLKGATMAASALSGGAYFNLLYPMKMCCNLIVNVNYTVVAVGSNGPANVAAILAGKVAGYSASLLANYPLLAAHTLKSIYNFTEAIPTSQLWVNNNFLAAHPQDVKAVVYALDQAGFGWDTNPAAAQSTLMEFYSYSSAQAAFAYQQPSIRYSIDGATSISANQVAVNILLNFQQITANVTASSYINQDFAPTLK